MRFTKLLALGLLPLLLAPAAAQDTGSRDISVESTATAHRGSLRVSISADRADATYAIGETARLFIKTNEDAFVAVYGIGPTGRVHQLFPNAYQTDNHVWAHQTIEIAGGATGGRIAVSGPVGTEVIKVVASREPLTVIGGRSGGEVDALLRNLEVVGDADAGDRKIAVASFALHTVRRTAAVGSGAIVIVPGPTYDYPAVYAVPGVSPWAPTYSYPLPQAGGNGTIVVY